MFWDLFSLKEYVKLIENNIYGQNQGRNVMKNIKVIMCDIDGTLLNSKGIVTSKTIDAIKKVREQGILFGISTGRDVPSVKRLFGKWGIGGLVDMIVGSNGGEIYDYKTDYYEENFALPGNLIANIMEHYKDMDVNFAIHGDGVLYTPKEDELIKILSKGDQLPYEVIDFDEYLKRRSFKNFLLFANQKLCRQLSREQKPLKMNVSNVQVFKRRNTCLNLWILESQNPLDYKN